MIYFDTSALIKGFVSGKGSPLVRSIQRKNQPVATATIAYAEIYSGLTRKLREGKLSASLYRVACQQFEREWGSYVHVELQQGILVLSRDLIQRHPLRGFDALHLASAVSLGRALSEAITFVATDRPLLKAAEAESLHILNVEIASSR